MTLPKHRGLGKWLTFGNLTIYTDIPIPFTKYAIVLDIGRHPSLGYRWRR